MAQHTQRRKALSSQGATSPKHPQTHAPDGSENRTNQIGVAELIALQQPDLLVGWASAPTSASLVLPPPAGS